MTKLETFLACFVGITGTLLMVGGIWFFSGSLDVLQRILMFLLGLSTNAAITGFISWRLDLFGQESSDKAI